MALQPTAAAPKLRNPVAVQSAVVASPRMFHTGTHGPALAADFNNTTPGANTEIYVAEMLVHLPCFSTGAAIFNGSDVTDAVKIGLYNKAGQLVCSTASTAGSGTDAVQKVAWAWEFLTSATTATAVTGPVELPAGTYYIGVDFASTTSRFQTFVAGSFGAGKITGAVYATAMISTSLTITPPTTFTTILGPVVSLY
jgi:uncharacterized membrane protein